MMKEKLPKKYPYIGLSRFKILTHIDRDAKAHPEVLYTNTSRGSAHEVDYNIGGDDKERFWGNPRFTQYLYSNRSFPLLWIGEGPSRRSRRVRGAAMELIYGMMAYRSGLPFRELLNLRRREQLLHVAVAHITCIASGNREVE